MDSQHQCIITELLQLLLSVLFLIQSLLCFIASKLRSCCYYPCIYHLQLEEELEKERSSAAIAAEEAMAVMSRLQKEKAALELEARQYRRTAEQKHWYDQQIISFLEEMVLKLEQDRHVSSFSEDQKYAFSLDEEQSPLSKGSYLCHRDLEEELEKERHANAVAAEQSMAMISRLQKEKASLEMDALQYRRTAEQRHLYDLQKISFLKEFILKLERENHASEQCIVFAFPPERAKGKKHRSLPKVCLRQSSVPCSLSARLFE